MSAQGYTNKENYAKNPDPDLNPEKNSDPDPGPDIPIPIGPPDPDPDPEKKWSRPIAARKLRGRYLLKNITWLHLTSIVSLFERFAWKVQQLYRFDAPDRDTQEDRNDQFYLS